MYYFVGDISLGFDLENTKSLLSSSQKITEIKQNTSGKNDKVSGDSLQKIGPDGPMLMGK